MDSWSRSREVEKVKKPTKSERRMQLVADVHVQAIILSTMANTFEKDFIGQTNAAAYLRKAVAVLERVEKELES